MHHPDHEPDHCLIRLWFNLDRQIARRRAQIIGPLLALVAALFPRVALADIRSPFDPASPQGDAIANLFWFVIVIAAVIFVGVEGAIIYSSVAHRDRPGRVPSQFSGSRRVEIAWTIAPALLLVIVFVLTVRTMNQVSEPGSQPLRVDVLAHQWWWEFRYPDENLVTANELHVPVGRTVELRLESTDVIHSFWVPELAGKVDANPGHPYTLVFTAQKPGTYLGQCSEFCGVGHAWMLIRVIAQTPSDYEAWVQAEKRPAAPPTGLASEGQRIFMQQPCQNCHTIAGTAASGTAGPDLTHVGSRQTIGAGVLANTPANMERWLQNPLAVKPGALMPNFNLTPDELRALAAYMESLR